MRTRTTLRTFASLAFVLGLAACGGSAQSTSEAASVPMAKANLPRDPEQGSTSALAAAVTANNAFALDLYSHVRTGSAGAGNLMTSPLSASLALTMTYAGAHGTTASQMASALHFNPTSGSIFDGQNALSQELARRGPAALSSAQDNARGGQAAAPSADNYQLEVVNSVWGEKTYTWEAPFLDTLARSYGTGVYQQDFVHQFDQARQTINSWVSTRTADKINDLLAPGALDDTTRMVLVNAIHLKFPWDSTFAPSATASASFTRASGSTVAVPFMHQTVTAGYADDGQAQIVSLPLEGRQVTVVIALPHGDLATYEAGLAAAQAVPAVPTAAAEVTLSLPKVTFTSPTFSLATALKAMGMTQAFDPHSADFTGLCAHPPDHDNLYVSDVLQKAMIGMEETGVEAAAATAVVVAGSSAEQQPPPPVTMVVNRPYLVSIVDVPTGAILFLGHIVDPSGG